MMFTRKRKLVIRRRYLATIEVETLDGEVSLVVPEARNPASRYALKEGEQNI